MNNTEKNFIQGLKNIRLGSEAKLRIREQLVAYSELHSMPAVEQAPFNGVSFISSIFGHSRRLVATTLALAILLVGGGASTFAAEKAVPGDVLYGVKVGINEPVAAVFAGSGDARARHHARLAVRRVQEAELLRARGALTVETEEELSDKIDIETSRVIEEAGKLALAGDVSASIAVRIKLADDLTQYAQEGSAEADTATAAAPMMAKAVLATPERETASVSSVGTRTVREVLGKKLVLLRVAETESVRTRAVSNDEPKDTGDAETAVSRPSRGLLSGTSVERSEGKASTTATSTPAFGKKFFERLMNRDEDKNKDTKESKDVRTKEPLPEKSIPLPTLPVRVNVGL